MGLIRTGFLALALVAPLASGCSNDGCTLANCTAVRSQCHIVTSAEPNDIACQSLGPPPQGFDSTQYCPAACSAADSSSFYQCMAKDTATCGDLRDGGQAADLAQCQTNGPAPTPVCSDTCNSTRTTCEQGCPDSGSPPSYQNCMDCAAQCGIKWAQCEKACPTG